MQKRREFTFATLPSTDSKRSDAKNFSELRLTIVVFGSPFLEFIGCHGVTIHQKDIMSI